MSKKLKIALERSTMVAFIFLTIFVLSSCSNKAKSQPSQTRTKKIIRNADGTEMVRIESGRFIMGFDKGVDTAMHLVEINSVYMDVNEVTQKSFERLMGFNPAKFSNSSSPVERVRWTEAAKYCNARSKAEKLKPCYDEETWTCDFSANGYRLPTEAEWEYACRAGTEAERFFDGPEMRLKRYGWYRDNSKDKTHPAGQKQPNPWGLYDMYGNVAEWCNDYYAKDYYKTSPQDNPKGPVKGKQRVIRGGSWQARGKYVNSYYRTKDDPALADVCQGYPIYGFRCVRKAQ